MVLRYRKRGKFWHCRGTVRIGRRAFEVHEFSTGSQARAEAEAVGAAEEARIRREFLETGTATSSPRTMTIGECIALYRARPGELHPFDSERLTELERRMGDVALSGAREAWRAWLGDRGRGLASSTIGRWRATLLAALRHGANEMGITVPSLPSVRIVEGERIAYLSTQQERRLLAAYSRWARPVMVVLCETGLRTQEALRLDWRCVDWQRNVLIVEHAGRSDGPRTKTGKSRRVGMRPTVRDALHAIWQKRGCPEYGPVFLSKRGRPYADTRRTGGNPLTKAHRTACRKAGIEGFRIHDWRHHFAIWFLKRGGNLRALCQIAGWSSIRMVQRYAAFEQSDLDDLMLRTAEQQPTAPPACPDFAQKSPLGAIKRVRRRKEPAG